MESKAKFAKRQSFTGDIFRFLMSRKKWWLTPIVVVIVLMGVLLVLGGTGAAPFIYTLF